jgi:hypothetical protein
MFGDAGLYLMAVAIMISTFGCNNGLILAGARVYYAMARDNLFFRRTGELHPTHRTPAFALGGAGGVHLRQPARRPHDGQRPRFPAGGARGPGLLPVAEARGRGGAR